MRCTRTALMCAGRVQDEVEVTGVRRCHVQLDVGCRGENSWAENLWMWTVEGNQSELKTSGWYGGENSWMN